MASKKEKPPKEHVQVMHEEQLEMVRELIKLFHKRPEIYKHPELDFFVDYIKK